MCGRGGDVRQAGPITRYDAALLLAEGQIWAASL